MSNPLPSTGGVEISNIQLVNLPSGYRTYSVEISHNKKVKRKLQRKKVDGNRIVWFESLLFPSDLTDQSIFYFKIVKIFGLKMPVGSWNEKVTNLFQLQKDSGSCKFDFSEGCQLKFTIKQQDDILSELVNEVDNIPAGTSEHPVEISNAIMNAHDTFTSQEDMWTPFLSLFGVFMNAIDTISEVHPYVKLAWSVLSVIPKTIISQSNRNDSINKLLQRLKEVYEYITDTNRLPTLKETQSKTLSVLVQQTIECAYFLREYDESHIGKKILTGSSIDGKISDFNETFTHILDVITNSVALETGIVTLRISNDISGLRKGVKETKDLTLLGELPYAEDAGFSSSKCCFPGTREKLITEILDWVNGNGSQQVLLLLGQAGRGKSAIAHTISQIFDIQNRLGAIFCFNRSYKDRRNLFFSTIAHELADGDIQWRESLVRIIEKTSTRKSSDIQTQFNELIIKPSTEVNTIGPVVIVIDGLDESGDRTERAGLLDILQRCSELPSNFRFIITSRPELDIEEWSKHPTFVCKRMDDIDLGETTQDIQRYISSRFSRVKDILDKELNDGWSLLLARRAEGLFQWARTVCDFIDPTVKFEVVDQVKEFISRPTSSLYALYHQILNNQPEFRRPKFLHEFKKVIGALVIMRKPPSMQSLQSLFPEYKVKTIIQPFHSLFLGIDDMHTPIRPLHTSLTDFLTTRFIDIIGDGDGHGIKTKTEFENQFYIDTSDQGYFTLACLKLMNSGESGLRFNICNLETSHKHNRDVLDLDDRIQAEISWHLSYTCYFWAIHLQQSEKNSDFNKDLLEHLRLLMRTNALYLFEVFGLLHEVEQVCISMNILAEWCKGMDSELYKQAKDTCQFGYDFEDVIMESTPHLYISALPFAQEDSFILKQYLDSFPHHLSIELGQSLGSPRNSDIVKRIIDASGCVIAFSPLGTYIATGFESGKLWLWNYGTGEIVHKSDSFIGSKSIVFSPTGETVFAWYFYKTSPIEILIWNIDTNEVSIDEVSIPNHEGRWTISNNGCYLVIAELESIWLYDITTRSGPKQLAYFSCLSRKEYGQSNWSLSPNGDLLAFQLNGDDAISLWSNPARKVIGSFEVSESVQKMAFSADGNRIGVVFNGFNERIEIWDVSTKKRICKFECGQYIDQFSIFPDGQHIVFSSHQTIYIWNVPTGNLAQSWALKGKVNSLAVSPDCKHIASVGSDGTIRVQEWENVSRTTDVRDGLFYHDARLSPGGRHLIIESYKDDQSYTQSYLQVLNTATMSKLIDQVRLRSFTIAVSPDDQYIAYIATNGLCLWSIMRGEIVLDADRYFTALALNGDYLISGDRNGNIIIWNTHTCQPSKMMTSETPITALAFSATGTRFLVVYFLNSGHETESVADIYGGQSEESVIEIYDSQSGEILKGPFTCSHSLLSVWKEGLVAFSPNESRIIYLISQEAFVLDAETGQVLKTFKADSLKLSPNGKYLWTTYEEKSCDRSVTFSGIDSDIDSEISDIDSKIWDIDSGVEIEGQWLASEGYMLASEGNMIAFSNKPEEILTVHATGVINFWHIGTGNKTMTLMFHPHFYGVHNLRVSSNENRLVLDFGDSIKVWSLEGRGERQAMSCVYEDQGKTEHLEKGIRSATSSRLDERERREYALVAWQNALFSDSSEMDWNGWILGPNKELLFWIPKERRAGLWRPGMVYTAGPDPITRLNFDNFVHGSRWTECKEPLVC